MMHLKSENTCSMYLRENEPMLLNMSPSFGKDKTELVVDNNSRAESIEIIKEYEDSTIH